MAISEDVDLSQRNLALRSSADAQESPQKNGVRALEMRPQTAADFIHDWVPAAFYLLFDILCWFVIYSVASFLRREGYSAAAPLQIFLVELLQLAVIVAALFIIGGYDRHTEMRSLSYTTEHILALIGAAAASALLIYSAAAFDASIRPSRGVLLVSFIAFLPLSLIYRRWVRRFVAEASAKKVFLVIGSGEVAAHFRQAYEQSDNPQQLEFVAGENLKSNPNELAAKIDNLDQRYSGIILAEHPNALEPELLDRLVRTQFQRTRVYTLESFYETHWRYVPLNAIDPVWPLQTGFQLARISPYHYLKRLFDLIVSTVALIIFAPLIAIGALLIWLESGRPVIFSQERVGRDEHRFILYKFRTMKS